MFKATKDWRTTAPRYRHRPPRASLALTAGAAGRGYSDITARVPFGAIAGTTRLTSGYVTFGSHSDHVVRVRSTAHIVVACAVHARTGRRRPSPGAIDREPGRLGSDGQTVGRIRQSYTSAPAIGSVPMSVPTRARSDAVPQICEGSAGHCAESAVVPAGETVQGLGGRRIGW